VMIPFLSISGTGSHVTMMAVEELVMARTLLGGAFGSEISRKYLFTHLV